MVHRDVKPDNILVHEGKVLLADFGLAVYTTADTEHSTSMDGSEDADDDADYDLADQDLDGADMEDEDHDDAGTVDAATEDEVATTALACSLQGSDALLASHPLASCEASPRSSHGGCYLAQLQHNNPPTMRSCSSSGAEEECQAGCGEQMRLGQHPAVTAIVQAQAGGCLGRSHPVSQDGSIASEVRARMKRRMQARAEGSTLMRRPASSPELVGGAGGTPLYTAPEVLLAMFQSRPLQTVVGHKVGRGCRGGQVLGWLMV